MVGSVIMDTREGKYNAFDAAAEFVIRLHPILDDWADMEPSNLRGGIGYLATPCRWHAWLEVFTLADPMVGNQWRLSWKCYEN